MKPYNIPAHTNCTNCGDCCGIIPVDANELAEIMEYIKEHNITARRQFPLCPFRNEKKKKCDIYPVRPIICRLFGVADTGNLAGCPNGNSHNIDGRKFLPNPESVIILNFVDFTEKKK